ncbi:MAG: hypothetical protein C0497_12845 [Gemmatimonas sp.]|nr:hypothetical protein [Gemmatimonas sp.]
MPRAARTRDGRCWPPRPLPTRRRSSVDPCSHTFVPGPLPRPAMTPRLRALLPAIVIAGSLAAQPAPHKRIQQVMDRPEFTHATWGMEFYDLQAKKTVYATNRERLFVPVSTTKLVTTGTAFATLGAAHQFHTRIYRTGPVRDGIVQGDLVLVASGDPNLTRWEHPGGTYAFVDQDHSYGGPPLPGDPLAALRAMAQQIAGRGIRGATGQVIVDASLFREGTRELALASSSRR